MPLSRAPWNLIRLLQILPALIATWMGSMVWCATGYSAADAKKTFDIPATRAAQALKHFSAQSGAQVIFLEDALEGSRTKALKGAFTPAEAMDRLLAGTKLRAAHDRESGSFAVSRIPDPPKETNRPNG